MKHKTNSVVFSKPTRRQWLRRMATIVPATAIAGCASSGRRDPVLGLDVNKDVLWARREEWTGLEVVRSVIGIGDRFLMVRFADGNWDFPGGRIVPQIHGPKTKSANELIGAAANYIHTQAMVSVRFKEANLFAYGYTIDNALGENYMTYWVSLLSPSDYPPQPHPNLQDTTRAMWVPPDHSTLGKCLEMRTQEYLDAQEGKSILHQRCFEFSVG